MVEEWGGTGGGGKRTSSVSCSCSTSAVISGYKNRLAGSMCSNASLVKSFKTSTKKKKTVVQNGHFHQDQGGKS